MSINPEVGFMFASDELLDLHEQLQSGDVDPVAAGLVLPEAGGLSVDNLFHMSRRVVGWSEDAGVQEAVIPRFRTMSHLTEKGQDIVDAFVAAGLPPKLASAWRIHRDLLRKASVDHTPELLCILGIGRRYIPNLMTMAFAGPARPVLAAEIAIDGDNSNDNYCHALADLALEEGVGDYRAMHWELGKRFQPSLVSWATAAGVRQLNSVEAFKVYGRGILEFDRIRQLPWPKRKAAIASIVLGTMRHVVQRTDAA